LFQPRHNAASVAKVFRESCLVIHRCLTDLVVAWDAGRRMQFANLGSQQFHQLDPGK
jgi:hypothetical protein